jgi:proteasome lid subunit RPN8/RPN11
MREVIVKFQAFKEMLKYLSQYSSYNIPEEQWVESMGFLFCSVEDDYYIIEDAVGMTSGTELDVNLSPMKFGNINEIEREHEGFLGGWWHTHPNLSLFFSETDIKNQVFYQQNNPDGLGIVFDHTLIDHDFLGFRIFRLLHQYSDEVKEVPYRVLGFPENGLRDLLELIGVQIEIIDSLVKEYAGKDSSIKIDFSKLSEPLVDDPLADAEWIEMEGDELIEEDKIIKALKKYKLAANILEGTENQKEYASILLKLVEKCIEFNYMDNAKEEFELLKPHKSNIDLKKFENIQSKLQ